jgi:hypothetical protein
MHSHRDLNSLSSDDPLTGKTGKDPCPQVFVVPFLVCVSHNVQLPQVMEEAPVTSLNS